MTRLPSLAAAAAVLLWLGSGPLLAAPVKAKTKPAAGLSAGRVRSFANKILALGAARDTGTGIEGDIDVPSFAAKRFGLEEGLPAKGVTVEGRYAQDGASRSLLVVSTREGVPTWLLAFRALESPAGDDFRFFLADLDGRLSKCLVRRLPPGESGGGTVSVHEGEGLSPAMRSFFDRELRFWVLGTGRAKAAPGSAPEKNTFERY